MKYYLSLVLLGFLIHSTDVVQGQEQETKITRSSVVISEANISSLAAKLKDYKEQWGKPVETRPMAKETIAVPINESSLETRLLRQYIAQLEQELTNRKALTVGGTKNNFAEKNGNDDIRDVKDELNELKFKIGQLSNEKNNAPIIINATEDKPTIEGARDNRGNSELSSLKKQLDSLYNTLNTPNHEGATDYSGNFDSLENKLNILKNELETKKSTPTDYSLLKAKYKDYLKRIFFANNSTTLNTETVQIMEELNQILDANDNIDVLIKGFASNKGSVEINEKLSMLRTEEVKKALVLKGIHPTRIMTQYHGIDYGSKDESDARRVEITLLVRK